jgi:predicted ATPase/DNA-binding SARP family transcriptional activator/tetratricopeptide (TPR) repeat protein
VEVRVLGPFEVAGDDGEVIDVGGPRPRALLAALALAGGRLVPADQLLDEVWHGEELDGRNRLQVHISRLRRVLGGDRILTKSGGYALQIPAGALDADRFDAMAARGRAALHREDAAEAARQLGEALGLWRGEPLAEFADAGFAQGVITRLGEARLAATEDMIEAELMLGHHGELTGRLEALVAAHPVRERLWGQLIVALYRCGRQADALAAYRRARTLLADELGVDPGPELRRLEAAVLAQDPELAAPPARPAGPAGPAAGNLPAAASGLIGRHADLGAVTELLRAGRLVTITGAGGVGKTRLAIEAARGVAGGYPDGAWLVELAPVGEDAAVADAAMAALGVAPGAGPGPGAERLSEFLARRRALLVLDNCEHVIGGAARMADHLIARCPELRILATSRENLAVAGESLWPLEPLAMDAAAELFVARARAASPDFPADRSTATVIAGICARLDGLPLAIELAAARMRALAPEDVLDRLGDSFRLLTGGLRTAPQRHQTLQAVVDWSYDLLFEDERRLFEAMSVFSGPFPLEAAEQVSAGLDTDPRDVAGLLARLVDRSLITATRTGRGVRFRMLQTLADYGRERLGERGELAAARARHARWAAALADVPDSAHGPDWFATFSEFAADIRRAIDWALAAGDADTALVIAYGIGWFWASGGVLGTVGDCWQWLSGSLALPNAAAGPRVRALALAEQLALAQGRRDALAYGDQAVAEGRAAADRQARAFAVLLHGSALAGVFGQRERAVGLLEEAGALLEAEADDWGLGIAALTRGVAALARSEPDQAQRLLRSAVDRFARTGHSLAEGGALRHLADVAVLRGRYDEAISALQQMLTVLPPDNHPAGITRMAQIACLYAFCGQPGQAERWHTRAEAAAENQQHVHLQVLTGNARGLALRRLGRPGDAGQCLRRALQLAQDRNVPEGLAMAHASLGRIAELRGDVGAAEEHHQASLDTAREVADRQAQALALEGLGSVASLRGAADAAGRLFGAAAAFREGTVATVLGQGTGMRETILGRLAAASPAEIDTAITRLGDRAAFDAGYAEGAADPMAVLRAARSRPGRTMTDVIPGS